MKKIVLLLVAVGMVLPIVSRAQGFRMVRRNRDLMLNVGLGTAKYYGEMTNPGELGKIKPSVIVGAEYYFSRRISGRAQFAWFQTSGDDADAGDSRRVRNLSFTSNNFELTAIGVVGLIPQGFRFYDRPGFNLHAFAGIGVMRFNPVAEYNGKKYALQTLATEGVSYSRITPVVPFGLGARIKVNPFTNVLIEGGYRLTFTDYMDDVSARLYPDPATLKSDIARALSDRRAEYQEFDPTRPGIRGNPETNDGYFLLNVSLQYYIPYELNKNSQRKLYDRRRYQRQMRRR